MKKKMILTATLLFTCFLVACGSKAAATKEQNGQNTPEEQQTESKQPEMDDKSLEGILKGINDDFSNTIQHMSEELETVNTKVGGTYEGYVENKQLLIDWYSMAEEESRQLFDRTKENSVKYYKLVADTVDHEDYDAWDNALDDYYDEVYDGALDDYYDAVYDDFMDDIYDEYYDGIMDDAYDTVAYKEWSDASGECYKMWSDGSSSIYKGWSDECSDVYKLWSAVSSGFYKGNFEVDAIVKEAEAAAQQETSDGKKEGEKEDKTDDAEKTDDSGETSSSAEGVDPELKEFLDGYEAFMNEYVEFMKKYQNADSKDVGNMISDYGKIMGEYGEYMEKIKQYNPDTMNAKDAGYYLEVTGRITQKLLELSE